jgi:hypothetical protein
MCLGGWLSLGSGTRLLAGFTLAVISVAGLVVLARRKNSLPPSRREEEAWGYMREQGKSHYIRKAVIKGALLGVASSSLAVFVSAKDTGLRARDLGLFVALTLIITFAFYYTATKVWDANNKRGR